jgi:hypothetical protein
MAGAFGGTAHNRVGKRQVPDLYSSELTKDDPIQTPKPLTQDVTQVEWGLDTMDSLNADITETLDRITSKTSHEEGRRAPKETRDIKPSLLCDFCDHIFTHLKPSPPREDAPKYTGGLWTPQRKTQSTAQFERSATEITCSFCHWRWNQLEVVEQESLTKDVGEDDILLYPNNLPLQLKVKYPFAEFPKTLLLAPCHGKIQKSTRELDSG